MSAVVWKLSLPIEQQLPLTVNYLSSPILYYSLTAAKVCLLSDVNYVDFYNALQL